MKIVITGGAGCLGANLIDRWHGKDHDILVIDNLATGYQESLPAAVEFVEGSIVDEDFVAGVFSTFNPDWVVHSAAAYKDPSDWASDAATNVTGTINVVRCSLDQSVARFVNFQTALCYGRPSQIPIDVSSPLAPFTSYGISKTAGELYVMMSELNAVSLRLANVTGPRLAIGPIPTFYQRLKNQQSCFCTTAVRDFLDMEDFLDFVDVVFAKPDAKGIFNVSTGEGHSIKEIYEAVERYLGLAPNEDIKVVPVGEDDVQAVVLDPRATTEVFGWKAKVGFEEMMNRMLKWYDEYGVTAIHSHLSQPK